MENQSLPPEHIEEMRVYVQEAAKESFPTIDFGDGPISGPHFLLTLEDLIKDGEVRPDSMDAYEELKLDVMRIQGARMGMFPGYVEDQVVFIPLSDLEADFPTNLEAVRAHRDYCGYMMEFHTKKISQVEFIRDVRSDIEKLMRPDS